MPSCGHSCGKPCVDPHQAVAVIGFSIWCALRGAGTRRLYSELCVCRLQATNFIISFQMRQS